jgi:hypothetical protein
MKLKLLTIPFLLATALFSCQSDDQKPSKKIEIRTDGNATCETFWANYGPEKEEKIKLLTEFLEMNKTLRGENKGFLLSLLKDLKRQPNADSLLLTTDYSIYPIFQLKQGQTGIKGIIGLDDTDERSEEFAKEHHLLKENFGYQSIDSVGKLVYFTEEFSELFKDNPPKFHYYTLRRKGSSKLTNLAYLGDDCLSYFHYDISLSDKEKTDSILFGSKFSLDLEFGSFPIIDKAFKTQFAENCMDCPTNYPDQKTFAKLKGVEGIYFVYADDFPLNTKLARPSRSIVLQKEDGSVVTLWKSEIDLSGCGCL